jgi:hypothetical protein
MGGCPRQAAACQPALPCQLSVLPGATQAAAARRAPCTHPLVPLLVPAGVVQEVVPLPILTKLGFQALGLIVLICGRRSARAGSGREAARTRCDRPGMADRLRPELATSVARGAAGRLTCVWHHNFLADRKGPGVAHGCCPQAGRARLLGRPLASACCTASRSTQASAAAATRCRQPGACCCRREEAAPGCPPTGVRRNGRRAVQRCALITPAGGRRSSLPYV